MAYQVLYRKYRPRDFSEVLGQEHITAVIRRQIQTGRVAHAYLFSGPRGVGKTTVARLIAKAVNCAAAPDGRPCNACAACAAFNAGSALNLIEIDAASNRGIDEIRELRESARVAPAEGGSKVYIVDEVHQLTREAFNALLKILEEPPGHVLFVLATTELERVPQTVVSRTQHFDFRRPRDAVIRERLAAIAASEGAALEPDAARVIAAAAEGSLRDAESMLGKVLAVAERVVTRADVEEVVGIPPAEAVRELSRAVMASDLPVALGIVRRLYQDGYEMDRLTKLLIASFREALLDALSAGSSGKAAAGGVPPSSLVLPPAALADAMLTLIESLRLGRASPLPELPLELALVRIMLCHASPDASQSRDF